MRGPLKTIDLTATKLFLMREDLIPKVVNIVQRYEGCATVCLGNQAMKVHVVLRILMNSLQSMFALWHTPRFLLEEEILRYEKVTKTFARTWQALAWKPTVWVHWMVAHSTFFVKKYHTLYIFSSVPVEKRHQAFKHDLKHCFQGWKLSRAYLHRRGLVHCIKLNALDLGIRLEQLKNKEGNDRSRKRLRL